MANLVHLIHRFPPAQGGAEIVALQACSHLIRLGYEVRVETTNALSPGSFHELFSKMMPPGIFHEGGITVRRHRCIRIPLQKYFLTIVHKLAPLSWKPWLNWYSPIVPGMVRMTSDHTVRPDQVVVWALPHGSVWAAALRLAQSRRVPLVAIPLLHPGNPAIPHCPIRRAFRSPCLANILKKASHVVALTAWEKQELVNLGVSPASIQVCGLGVDPATVAGGNREKLRKSLGIDPHTLTVGHLTTLSREKGTLDLLEARIRLPMERGPMILLAGQCTPIVKKALARLGHKPWLRVLGTLTQEQRRDFYAAIDLMCLPSVVDSWSLTILESWSTGLGTVVYNAGGPAELVRHNVDGWKIQPGDIDGLTHLFGELAKQPEICSRWGKSGQSRIATEFCLHDAMDRFAAAIVKPLQSGLTND